MAKKKVLLADDDKQCAMLICQLLEEAGYEVDECSGGSEVLRRLSMSSYDLLLLDFNMRDIKGDRLSLMISMDPQFEKMPIVIVTGHIEKADHVFKEYGAKDVIYKPIENRDFVAKIRSILGDNT